MNKIIEISAFKLFNIETAKTEVGVELVLKPNKNFTWVEISGEKQKDKTLKDFGITKPVSTEKFYVLRGIKDVGKILVIYNAETTQVVSITGIENKPVENKYYNSLYQLIGVLQIPFEKIVVSKVLATLDLIGLVSYYNDKGFIKNDEFSEDFNKDKPISSLLKLFEKGSNLVKGLVKNILLNVAKSKNTSEEYLVELSKTKVFAELVAGNTGASSKLLDSLSKSKNIGVLEQLAKNKNTSVEVLKNLVKTNNDIVLVNLSYNPKSTGDMLEELVNKKIPIISMGVAGNVNAKPETLEMLASNRNSSVRNAVASNPSTSVETLTKLVKDEDKSVRKSVLNNPNVTEDLIEQLKKDEDEGVVFLANESPVSKGEPFQKVAPSNPKPMKGSKEPKQEVLKETFSIQTLKPKHKVSIQHILTPLGVDFAVIKTLVKRGEPLVKNYIQLKTLLETKDLIGVNSVQDKLITVLVLFLLSNKKLAGSFLNEKTKLTSVLKAFSTPEKIVQKLEELRGKKYKDRNKMITGIQTLKLDIPSFIPSNTLTPFAKPLLKVLYNKNTK